MAQHLRSNLWYLELKYKPGIWRWSVLMCLCNVHAVLNIQCLPMVHTFIYIPNHANAHSFVVYQYNILLNIIYRQMVHTCLYISCSFHSCIKYIYNINTFLSFYLYIPGTSIYFYFYVWCYIFTSLSHSVHIHFYTHLIQFIASHKIKVTKNVNVSNHKMLKCKKWMRARKKIIWIHSCNTKYQSMLLNINNPYSKCSNTHLCNTSISPHCIPSFASQLPACVNVF